MITNVDGVALPALTLMAIGENDVVHTGVSDEKGVFAIVHLPRGVYRLHVFRADALRPIGELRLTRDQLVDIHVVLPARFGDRLEERQRPIVDRRLTQTTAD